LGCIGVIDLGGGNREDGDKPMKKRFLLATIAIVASQSACSTQYRIEMDPNAFLATWNQHMHGPDMALHRQQGNGDATLVSEHWLLVTQNTKDNAPGIQARVDEAQLGPRGQRITGVIDSLADPGMISVGMAESQ
jgi:hypothetical protein